jgi:hypothetical protein
MWTWFNNSTCNCLNKKKIKGARDWLVICVITRLTSRGAGVAGVRAMVVFVISGVNLKFK